jgi:ornithine cyclodeaminase/alanine dehydrogenase-like protein (mu-crystallin family)
MMTDFVNITGEQVRSMLTMKEAIGSMRAAFVAVSNKEATVPLRTAIDIPGQEARALFMPVYVPSLSCIGVKIVSVYPNNSAIHRLPNIHGKILLIGAEDGVPLCLMDAEYLTALRTGAASGVATDLLAVPEAGTLAIFGTGVQALAQVEGVCTVRKIEKVFVYGREASSSLDFAALLRKDFGLNAEAGGRADLRKADVVCTATNSSTPVLDASDIKRGCHINAIGSFKPGMQELPPALVVMADVFVDQLAAVLSEPGDILGPLSEGLITASHIKGELGEILCGRIGARTDRGAITLFKSVGNAVQDIYAAKFVYDKLNFCKR